MGLGKEFLDMIPKVQNIEEQIDKLGSSKLRTPVLWKVLLGECKTSHRLGQNITNHKSDKESVSRIYKELLKLNKKNKQLNK